MEILVLFKNQKSLAITRFYLESIFGDCIIEAEDLEDALTKIKKSKTLNLFITENSADDAKISQTFKQPGLSSKIKRIQILNQESQPNQDHGRQSYLLATLTMQQVPQQLVPIIKTEILTEKAIEKQTDYFRLPVNLIHLSERLKAPIFIRLSDLKFVKLFNSGQQINDSELQQMSSSKKQRSLYIRAKDAPELFSLIHDYLMKTNSTTDPATVDELEELSQANALVHQLAHKMGFTPEVQQLAKDAVLHTLTKLGNSNEIRRTLSRSSLRGKNYISYHSVILANIACAMVYSMNWQSETALLKIVMASFFHDFALHDDQLAQLTNLNEITASETGLSEDQRSVVISHTLHSAEVVRQLREIPSDVDSIIYQHHERPDGTGFPKGLFAHQITALSSLFIFCHEIVDEFVRNEKQQPETFQFIDFLKSKESYYNRGSFKKLWTQLYESVSRIPG